MNAPPTGPPRRIVTVTANPAVDMTYHVDGDTVVTPHTEVDVEHGGRGHGKELVRGALDSIRADGRFVEPLCPFVRSYIRRHPDYQDLVKGS